VGHLQVVTGLTDQLYRNACLVLQEDYNSDMFRHYVGHLQVVTGLTDQLYRNAWGVLGEFWGWGAPPPPEQVKQGNSAIGRILYQ